MNNIPYLPVEIQEYILNIKIKLEMKEHNDYYKDILVDLNCTYNAHRDYFNNGTYIEFYFAMIETIRKHNRNRIRFADTDDEDEYLYQHYD